VYPISGVVKLTNAIVVWLVFCMEQIAVVVFPLPSELNSRAAKRFKEMGKDVPAEAVNQMTGIYLAGLLFSIFNHDICRLVGGFFFYLHLLVTNLLNVPLAVNFILPQSKDMPGSKEPFDEVCYKL
jgi:heterogeneous nuclear ribonucleoprotein U-like protein 1